MYLLEYTVWSNQISLEQHKKRKYHMTENVTTQKNLDVAISQNSTRKASKEISNDTWVHLNVCILHLVENK